jgi:hypothetical protein
MQKSLPGTCKLQREGFKLVQSRCGINRSRQDRNQHTICFFIEGSFQSASELSHIRLPAAEGSGAVSIPDVATQAADSGSKFKPDFLNIGTT